MSRYTRIITLSALCLLVCMGAIMVFFQVKPFWIDEWFIIDNLKSKSRVELWGQLHFLQQFPRTYLVLFKSFAAIFKYNYFSLRFPSFVIGLLAIVLSYNVGKKLLPNEATRYLFVLILVSSYTFTEYFVEAKQYTMDILVSVLALWQFAKILALQQEDRVSKKRYMLLCASFVVAPFFSYTYPLCIAPVYVIMGFQAIVMLNAKGSSKRRTLSVQWGPLLLGILAVAVFYALDGKQLSADKTMQDRWSFLMIDKDHMLGSILKAFYTLFAQTGAGVIFEAVFGILGVSAFVFGLISGIKTYLAREYSLEMYLKLYCCIVIMVAMSLFMMGKLPIGSPRLNVFTTPSIGILIIFLLDRIAMLSSKAYAKLLLPALFYVATIGNLISSHVNNFTSDTYKKQMAIYKGTQDAIRHATLRNIPILVTAGITYPYEQATIDAGSPNPAVWVLKTFPAYDVHTDVPVYAIDNIADPAPSLSKLPAGYREALVGDGVSYQIVERK